MPARTIPFTDLYFGKEDPRNEASASEEDFLKSFVDLYGGLADVISGGKTLILGPKGTGKSALGLYLERTGRTGGGYFARLKTAASLPLAEIPQLRTGQPAGTTRTYSAWKFILLANYLDVVLSDPQVSLTNIRSVKRVIKTLAEAGFISSASGKNLLTMDNKSFFISREEAADLFKNEANARVSIYSLLPYMESWAQTAKSPNRHLLLLDGLDSILLNDEIYDESISGLTQAAYDINLDLGANATGSIVLLLRNDIFSRISLILPDAHKLRDVAWDLDWRVLSGEADVNAPLFQLVNRKSSQERDDSAAVDVLGYFPPKISVGKNKSILLRQYLLNLTRHTPRDILQLMEHIRQTCSIRGVTGIPTIDQSTIREGVLQYSSKYFVDAIRGELAGYEGGRRQTETALRALQRVPAQFTRSEFHRTLEQEEEGFGAKADEFLKLFFFAGALGNLFRTGSNRYMIFYHRRNDVDLNVQGTLILHNALTHAWSKTFGYGE